jgi:antitoxin component YwqK of YwqJK toxin-antitoxin module
MKRLLLIVLPLLLIVGCSKPIDESMLLKKGELMYEPNATKPYSGKVVKRDDKGWFVFDGNYKDGFRHGEWNYLTVPGYGQYNVTYTAGTYNMAVFTDSSGNEYPGMPVIEDPKQDGQFLRQNDGNEYDFRKYPNLYYTIRDDREDGLWIVWYENGQEEFRGNRKDFFPVGLWTEWHETGHKRSEGKYKYDEGYWGVGPKVGEWTYGSTDGKEETKLMYKDGKAWDGTFWSFKYGKRNRIIHFKDGEKDGLETYWIGDEKWSETTYKDGEEIDKKYFD